jgi:hypothetical protein
MNKYVKSLLAIALLGFSQSARADTTFGQDPITPYWHPLGPGASATDVYAQSFVAPVGGEVVSLGAWLETLNNDASTTLMFQILGSLSDNPLLGPSLATVLASTGPVGPFAGPSSFYSGAATSYVSLTAGETYWFALNAIGGGGIGSYQVAFALDDLADGGSFWYSNDGVVFDGQNYKPEIAFSVTVTDRPSSPSVPDQGSSASMLLAGVVGLIALRRKVAGK